MTNLYDDTVSVIDLTTREVVATVSVGDKPNGISFSALPTPATAPEVAAVEFPDYAATTSGADEPDEDEH